MICAFRAAAGPNFAARLGMLLSAPVTMRERERYTADPYRCVVLVTNLSSLRELSASIDPDLGTAHRDAPILAPIAVEVIRHGRSSS